MDLQRIVDVAGPVVLAFGLKIIGAIAAWIAGRWLIGVVVNIVSSAMERQKIDPTLTRYMGSVIAVALNIVLVVGILGYFGIETTSFAALMAAMGIAIGAAWGGLLANFAAGAFLLVLRPFKTGDFVTVGGLTGTPRRIDYTASMPAADRVPVQAHFRLCRVSKSVSPPAAPDTPSHRHVRRHSNTPDNDSCKRRSVGNAASPACRCRAVWSARHRAR